jgi:glycosyltransferase involved in cell wall biosynthesis
MREKPTITIGLPVRNEEKSISECLSSIRAAMYEADIVKDTPLVVCINGCSDNTEKLVRDFQKKFSDIRVEIIQSEEGLVNAQRKIVELYPAEIHIFPDGDNIIGAHSIKNILSAFARDKNTVVAYARTVPITRGNRISIFGRMGHLYDEQRMLHQRKYFHGRLFATRDWYIPKYEEIAARARKNATGAHLLKYTKGTTLLYADDVFMSNYILHTYGSNAICQVDDAECFSFPVGSLFDWWNVHRRTGIEVEKIRQWFPEYRYLNLHKKRKTDWKKWRAAPGKEKMLWLLFLVMRATLSWVVKVELLCARLPWFRPSDQWKATISTKRKHS